MLDAGVIIRGERGTFNLPGWAASRAGDLFEVAAITVAELWHGVARAKGRQRTSRERYLQAVLSAVPVISYTEQTALIHARLWSQMQTAGTPIGAYDLIVAATAVERGCEVATINRRHFQRVPGLTVVVPG
jgi:tRNA(fMet)-specific endonuclease VapC